MVLSIVKFGGLCKPQTQEDTTLKCAVSRLSWTSKCRCPKVPLEIVQIASHVSSSPRRQETQRPHTLTRPPRANAAASCTFPTWKAASCTQTRPSTSARASVVRSPHVRCPRQRSARPAVAGVVATLHKISWICSCNVPRPLQIECKTTSTAAREGNPINRGPGSRQKAPVRERCDSPAPTPTGPLRQPGSSTVAAHPDTTPSRERRRVLYIPHMEGNILHPNQAIDIGVRQRVRSPHVPCHQRRPSHPAGSRVPGLVQKSFFDL